MSTRRGALVDRAVLSLVAGVTTWLATLAWTAFTELPADFLGPLLLLALLVPATGIALHALRLPEPLVVAVQVVGTGLLATSMVAGAPVLTGAGWSLLGEQLATAVDTAQRYEAPVPADAPSIAPLLVLGGWVCLVLVDVFVASLRRVPLAGLPWLTIYSVPVSLLVGGVPWWSFALTAVGFLVLLFLQQRELASRWGRGLGTAGGRNLTGASPAVRAAAGSLGAASVVLAVLVPQFVPTLSLSVLGFGPGDGSGSDITVENPMTDLRRDLNRGEDVPLLRVRTDNPDPEYLRIAVLNNFTANEWSTGNRDIPDEQRAQGPLPLEDVDPSVPRRRFDHQVEVLPSFESTWLPTAYPIDQIAAPGDWRYDERTYDFLAADRSLDTAGLDYQMVEVQLGLDGDALADAASWTGRVSRDFVDLPDTFPTFVRSLATEVTRPYPSRYEKAVALQEWFREGGGFSYSLDRVDPGNGTDELVAFLTEGDGGRVGYCEQFASAMAAMARSLGIPARVAVGFLAPDPIGPRTFEYSAYDMHAWPELYFAGAGWVKFEPTPADRVPGVPSYTEGRLPQPDDPANPNQPEESADPSQTLQPDPRLDEERLPEGEAAGQQAEQGNLGTQLAVLGGVLLVLVLLLLPRTLRRARQRSRLRGGVEPVWDEVRASALDLGVPWPEHRSPRETRDQLVLFLGDPELDHDLAPRRGPLAAPEASDALHRLVDRLERQRYARPARSSGSGSRGAASADAELVLASLRAGATRRARRRADWWPVSALPWRRTAEAAASPTVVRHGDVVDQVGS